MKFTGAIAFRCDMSTDSLGYRKVAHSTIGGCACNVGSCSRCLGLVPRRCRDVQPPRLGRCLVSSLQERQQDWSSSIRTLRVLRRSNAVSIRHRIHRTCLGRDGIDNFHFIGPVLCQPTSEMVIATRDSIRSSKTPELPDLRLLCRTLRSDSTRSSRPRGNRSCRV